MSHSSATFVLSWTSGGDDRRPLYMYDHGASWGCTERRSEATTYPTARAALNAWLEKLAYPDSCYLDAIRTGEVRAERMEQLEMAL